MYWKYSTKRILTMEYCEGGHVNDLSYMQEHGISSDEVSMFNTLTSWFISSTVIIPKTSPSASPISLPSSLLFSSSQFPFPHPLLFLFLFLLLLHPLLLLSFKILFNLFKVSSKVGQIYSEMIFVQGFIHCDPHPGNILIRKNSKGNVEIVMLDHGLYQVGVTCKKKRST